ncbi:MAG: hypothetical protein FWD31_15985 [Planctomycetaceae bacterium]|nr:hypothetical protein [Planctomycetaceae bacterium]
MKWSEILLSFYHIFAIRVTPLRPASGTWYNRDSAYSNVIMQIINHYTPTH